MILSQCRVVLKDRVLDKAIIEIKEDKIKAVYESEKIKGINLQGLTVFPGFIDMHTHGANGVDFMDYHKDISIILKNALKEGVTSLLATTMTQTDEHIKKALMNIALYDNQYAKVLGVHLEGPFLSKEYKGAQNDEYIQKGTIDTFNTYQNAANNLIKLVTLAPEAQDPAFIEYLISNDIIVSIGHTNATHDEMKKAVDMGVHRVTHCFNAMRPLHHRDIGVVGSTLLYDEITPEIICDNHHVSDQAIQLLHKLKQDNIILVTDSMEAKNLEDGTYSLGGQTVTVTDQKAYIKDTIAGSTLRFDDAVKNIKNNIDINDIGIMKMTSYNQAKQLKLDNIGLIEEGYTADLTIVDHNYQVQYTIVDGEIRYKRG